MGEFRVGQVCRSGHPITDSADSHPEHREAFCSKCGSATTMTCEKCQTTIRGDYYVRGVYVRATWNPPRHCHHCGSPYPWTESKLRASAELIDELDELSETEREKLKASVEDLVRDSPSAEVAALRVKKAFLKLGKLGSESLRALLVDVLSEAGKKMMACDVAA